MNCNWEDLLLQNTATWDEIAAALWEGYEDKMELVLVYQLDDGEAWEFGVSTYGERVTLDWSAEDTPNAIRIDVEEFLSERDSLFTSLEKGVWQSAEYRYFVGLFEWHIDKPNQPHAIVFFRVYHSDTY